VIDKLFGWHKKFTRWGNLFFRQKEILTKETVGQDKILQGKKLQFLPIAPSNKLSLGTFVWNNDFVFFINDLWELDPLTHVQSYV